MSERTAEGAPRTWARLGGVFYLFTLVPSAFAEYYLRPGLIVRDNAAATAHNIMASEQLYRLALVCDLVGTTAYIGVTATLYILLRPVSRPLSLLAACSSVAGIAVGAASLAYSITPLLLLSGSRDLLPDFSP